jgi:hypothetical protein
LKISVSRLKNYFSICDDKILLILRKSILELFLFHYMKQNETRKVPKVPIIHICKNCDYITSRKSQYDRHLVTGKHINCINETNMKQNSSEKFHCLCGLSFGSRTTLWRHRKVCSEETNLIKQDDSSDNDLEKEDKIIKNITNVTRIEK